MDLFSMLLPYNLETFLITMCDGDTFPITEYILVCLYILKIWSDPCLSLVVCLLLLLLLHRRETIQTLAFHLFSDLATCDTVRNSILFLCLSPFIFMTEAENQSNFMILHTSEYLPLYNTMTAQNEGYVGGVASGGQGIIFIECRWVTWCDGDFIYTWHFISSSWPHYFTEENTVSESLSKLSKIKLKLV